MKNIFYKTLVMIPIMMSLLGAMTACSDDLEFDNPDGIPPGTAVVTANFDFMPLAEAALDTRSTSMAPAGDRFRDLEDLCILIYNRHKDLVAIHEFDAAELGLKMENRNPSDAVNGSLAEAQTWHGKLTFKTDYGKYYIYAVANLGQKPKGSATRSTTRQELEKNRDQIQTVDGLRTLKVGFDPENADNNRAMLGYFTIGQEEHAPVSGESPGVIIDRPSVNLHSWLRRCISKVTIDFDPSGLSENIHIYIRRATVRDLPADCMLGFTNVPDDVSQLLRIKDNPLGENASAHHIDFGDYLRVEDEDNNDKTPPPAYDSSSDDYTKWPKLMKANKKFPANAHSETAPCLVFYENMQGFGKDKRQFADKDGLVADRDIVKDNKPYGTYIEVEAYYQNLNAGSLSQGKIIYRFMLGQNVIDDYNAMRNCHYKLTLAFRGNANDADWHIVYPGTDPVVVPTPYYISYLYNHDMVLPLRMTPTDPNDKITGLHAKIVVNRWWPNNGDSKTYFSGNGCASDADTLNFSNGFLSLKPTFSSNVILESGFNYWEYNDGFYHGKRDGIDRSQRSEYPVAAPQDYTFTSTKTNESRTDHVSVTTTPGSNSVEWGIPLYTRAKKLVIQTGYTGNNLYSGHYRIAKVLFTATLNNNPATTMKKEVEIRQVARIVNPKGIYRDWNSREPFHVTLMELPEESDTNFKPFPSDGPWRAYIAGGDSDFIDIGRPGNKTAAGSSGSPIDFNVRFKGSGGADKVKCCLIRIEYNNYSCVHLIFVRQGYAPVPIIENGASWHTTNMLAAGVPATHPCDEGSMFKFGKWEQPIDVSAIVQPTKAWPDMQRNDFKSRTDELAIYGASPTYWSKIEFAKPGASFPTSGGKVATNEDIKLLVDNCDVGYGVLYADGATETAATVDKAYGYNRAKGHTDGYGMRGAFAYNATNDNCRGNNVFFPIGHTGYGQRKDNATEGAGSPFSAVLRYAGGRYDFMDAATEAWKRPPLWDLFRSFGAIYWARTALANGKGGLDINYFSFDFNSIDTTNMLKDAGSSACFVRCVD